MERSSTGIADGSAIATVASEIVQCLPPRRPTSVEFFGLPGSGKTTLALQVVPLLSNGDRAPLFSGDLMGDSLSFRRRSLCRLKLIARELPMQPGFAFRAARRLAAEPGHLWDRSKTIWNYCSVLAMSLRHARCGGDLLILDQGFVQAIWSAQMHGGGTGRPAPVAAYITDGWFEQCLFVHVKASKDMARSRLLGREQITSRLQLPDRVGQQALWEKGEAIDADLDEQLASELDRRRLRSRLMHVRNDGSASPQELAAAVFDRLHLKDVQPVVG